MDMLKKNRRKRPPDPAHSYTSFLAYKRDHEPEAELGTFVSQHTLSRWKAARLLHDAEGEPKPELARMYLCVREATVHAVQLVWSSRAAIPQSAESIVTHFARLSVYLDHLKALDAQKLLSSWPPTPGYTFGVVARWSALEAAWAVAESAHGGAQVGGQFGTEMFLSDSRLQTAMASPPDELVTKWAAGAMKELRERTLPPTAVWAIPGYLRRESEAIQYHMSEEYQRAISTEITAPTSSLVPQRGESDSDLKERMRLLGDPERDAIQALHEKQILGPDSLNPPSSKTLAIWAGYSGIPTFKTALSAAVKAGYLGNRKHGRNRRGGYYLTPLGERAATILNSNWS